MALPEFWRGSLTDYIFGPAWSSFDGSVQDSHAELILGEFKQGLSLSAYVTKQLLAAPARFDRLDAALGANGASK